MFFIDVFDLFSYFSFIRISNHNKIIPIPAIVAGDGSVVSVLVVLLIINIGIQIYGGIVLYHDPVCEQFTNTGLYKMAYSMFFIDSSLFFLVRSTLIACVRWVFAPCRQLKVDP